MAKLFGTDGIRGIAGEELTTTLAYKCGYCTAKSLAAEKGGQVTIFIGKDTRQSGDELEAALAEGILAAGGNACFLGVIPTPAVCFLTMRHGADAGIVISASHNPYEYNGIKIFGGTGYKLSDAREEEIEAMIENFENPFDISEKMGTASHFENDSRLEYANFIKSTARIEKKLKLVIDCANGASMETAKLIFSDENFEAAFICDTPDGTNINHKCGSTHIKTLCETVKKGNYDLGIAFDGDADRVLFVDEKGNPIDGDITIALLADAFRTDGELKGAVVVTVMSNLGLKNYLKNQGVDVLVTAVGDRNVLECMVANDCGLGGESSGHIILSDYLTTGDGQLTAMKFCEMLCKSDKPLSQLAEVFQLYPQKMINVKVPNHLKNTLACACEVKSVCDEIEAVLGGRGRILLRPSGTEALVRVMVESEDLGLVEQCLTKAVTVVEEVARNA